MIQIKVTAYFTIDNSEIIKNIWVSKLDRMVAPKTVFKLARDFVSGDIQVVVLS